MYLFTYLHLNFQSLFVGRVQTPVKFIVSVETYKLVSAYLREHPYNSHTAWTKIPVIRFRDR